MKSPKSPEVQYRNELNRIIAALRKDTAQTIDPILKTFQSEYVNDAYATTLEQAFTNLRNRWTRLETLAKVIANDFVNKVDDTQKRRFYQAMEDTIGIDLRSVIQNENLTDILTASTQENVALIRSIPDEYFKKIETIVYSSTTQGDTAGSIIKQISKIGKVTQSRAKLIARDQTSKLNSVLNQQRQQNLGVEEYVWRTSGDERVRSNHASKNGKVFRWDDPPKDTGHPGQSIQCRCVAQPIIKI